MKLSEYLTSGTFINRQAKLLIDVETEDDDRYIGDELTIIKKNEDGMYHAEDNDFAVLLYDADFEYIN